MSDDDWMRYWASPDDPPSHNSPMSERQRGSSSQRRTSSGARKKSRSRRRAAKRRSRIIGFSILGVVVLLVAVVAWIGVRGWLAKSELEAAIPLAAEIQTELAAGDTDSAKTSAANLQSHASAAAGLTGDPIWRAAEIVPGLGANLTAFREAAAVTDSIASDAIWPLANNVASFGLASFQPVNGAVDLTPILSVQQSVLSAASTLSAAADRADAIDTTSTIGPIADAVNKLQSTVHNADQLMRGVSKAVTLLPPMLGADGERNYLLVFQNPAEVRAGGGVTSALALINTNNGRVELRQQESSGAFDTFNPPAIALPSDTLGLYGERPAQYVQNTTLVPQFELSGQIASAMWKQRFGQDVDGVISFDPVALSYLLKSTGPINLPTGEELNADNAVQYLLSEVYAKYSEPSEQDAVFAGTAKTIFDRVSAGGVKPKELISALVQAGNEGRLRIWSAHSEDQEVLAPTSLSGPLPLTTDDSTGVGVYLNDGTGAKMDYYLDTSVSTASQLCRADSRPEFRISVTLTNSVRPDEVGSLTDYVTGGSVFGVPRGNIKTVVYVYGPESSGPLTDATIITNLDPGLSGAQSSASFDSGRTVGVVPVELTPGESRTITVDFLGQPGDPLTLSPAVTPMIKPTVYSTEIYGGTSGC